MPFTPMPLNGGEQTWTAQPDDYVVTNASASAITLPSPGYRLVKVAVTAGAEPSYIRVAYDGISNATFPCGSNGTNGQQAYAVTWPVPGTNIPAAVFTYSSGTGFSAPTAVTLTFSKGKSRGPPIANYRSVVIGAHPTGAESTVTAMSAVTFDVAPAIPSAVIAMSSAIAGGAVVYWPVVGASQSGHPCDSAPGGIVTLGNAPPLPKATSITMSYTTLAATYIGCVIGYDPA